MEVYFIRHGIAAPRGSFTRDEARPLINKGITKTTKVAENLLSIGLKFDLILTSPLVRAMETTTIFKQVGLTPLIETFNPLRPEGDIQQWITWLQFWQRKKPHGRLALVGHQPDLSNWAEILIWGSIQGQLTVKKAGLIGLRLPEIGSPISRSTLFLITSPKWICG